MSTRVRIDNLESGKAKSFEDVVAYLRKHRIVFDNPGNDLIVTVQDGRHRHLVTSDLLAKRDALLARALPLLERAMWSETRDVMDASVIDGWECQHCKRVCDELHDEDCPWASLLNEIRALGIEGE